VTAMIPMFSQKKASEHPKNSATKVLRDELDQVNSRFTANKNGMSRPLLVQSTSTIRPPPLLSTRDWRAIPNVLEYDFRPWSVPFALKNA
jgi:hypothetical protein